MDRSHAGWAATQRQWLMSVTEHSAAATTKIALNPSTDHLTHLAVLARALVIESAQRALPRRDGTFGQLLPSCLATALQRRVRARIGLLHLLRMLLRVHARCTAVHACVLLHVLLRCRVVLLLLLMRGRCVRIRPLQR